MDVLQVKHTAVNCSRKKTTAGVCNRKRNLSWKTRGFKVLTNNCIHWDGMEDWVERQKYNLVSPAVLKANFGVRGLINSSCSLHSYPII